MARAQGTDSSQDWASDGAQSTNHSSTSDWASDGGDAGGSDPQRALADMLMLRRRCEQELSRLHKALVRAAREDKPAIVVRVDRANWGLRCTC